MRESIPVVDLFAGPGGLGEGFATFTAPNRKRATFNIAVSIEKDVHAHQTLELRSFFRQFVNRDVPEDYYRYIRREITREQLFSAYPVDARAACKEARHAELGTNDDVKIYKWIKDALSKRTTDHWVLIGGPPCQAYSTAGRSRRRSDPKFTADNKHFLYREYLQIIAEFQPSVFVMENVKGILSSKVNEDLIFPRILKDLKHPHLALRDANPHPEDGIEEIEAPECQEPRSYRIFSLVVPTDDPETLVPTDFVIRSEEFGIPQTRHRVILLGVRSDLAAIPGTLHSAVVPVPAFSVLGDLPPLRSCLSGNKKNAGRKDSAENWRIVVQEVLASGWYRALGCPGRDPSTEALRAAIEGAITDLQAGLGSGGEYIPRAATPLYHRDWYYDARIGGFCNHTSRSHMGEDLHRYLYSACYAQVNAQSPKMRDFPTSLLPDHKNIQKAREDGEEEDFDDRFRVQVADRPATTITSHISKDGHYNIHYDPTQCRSLTVREAARLQTFRDNYFFEGARTQQYLQVGNAVPPLLAYKIAGIVHTLFEQIHAARRNRNNQLPGDAVTVAEDECTGLPVAL